LLTAQAERLKAAELEIALAAKEAAEGICIDRGQLGVSDGVSPTLTKAHTQDLCVITSHNINGESATMCDLLNGTEGNK